MGDAGMRTSFRHSTRARFAAATAGLVAGVGALILLVVYASMRFLTEYRIPTLSAVPGAAPTEVGRPANIVATAARPTTVIPTGIVVSSSADILNTLLIYSACALVALTAVGAIASWFLAGRMLRPLRSLSEAADLAGRGSLGHRVRTSGRDDEFDAVSGAFNRMLDELERSFAASQRFAANASHEIRTPLATTRALLEVAAGEQNTPAIELLLRRLSDSNERLIGITEALLDLAAIGREQLVPAPVDLSTLIQRELDDLDDEIVERRLEVTVAIAEGTASGSEGLFRLLLGNLLRNAVRHNHPGGRVTVETRRVATGGGVHIVVENSGQRIRAESIARLTEPFFRLQGRTVSPDGAAGHGLGLAIAESAARTLDGSLLLESVGDGGLRATVDVPEPPSGQDEPPVDAARDVAVVRELARQEGRGTVLEDHRGQETPDRRRAHGGVDG